MSYFILSLLNSLKVILEKFHAIRQMLQSNKPERLTSLS